MFQTKVVEKIATRILCSLIFLRKSCSLWDSVEKYGRARRAHIWHYNTTHALWMLDN